MANFNAEFSSLDKVLEAIQKTDVFDDDLQEKLLKAGSEELTRAIREESMRSGFDLKNIREKVGQSGKVKKLKNGTRYVVVSVKGKNHEGTPNGRIAFVLNYGRQEKYGKISGSYFWTRAVNRAERTIPTVYEEICVNEFIERGLV